MLALKNAIDFFFHLKWKEKYRPYLLLGLFQWSVIYRGEIWSRSFSDDTDLALHTVEYKMVHYFIINMDPKS